MARISQTQLAVLGALSVEPMTGYRLRAEITQTLGHFWHESFGQIYPTLASLEAAGLVQRETGRATSGNTFRITPEGLERLRELLVEPFQQPAPRNPLLLRLFFGEHVDPDLLRRWLVDTADEADRVAGEYEALRRELERGLDGDAGARFRLMTVLAGQHGARARSAWAREALALLGDAAAT